MNRSQLFKEILGKKSYLCVGLDTDLNKIPTHLLKEKDPVFEFNKQIIDATHNFCVAYKPNTAFYECNGVKGWESLQKTLEYIPKNIFTIADAKRGDIGNTSSMYATTFFNKAQSGFDFDAVTVAPYMGKDSVQPFLEYKNKWTIVLALTSNNGSEDLQLLKLSNEKPVYKQVLEITKTWGSIDQIMFVVGATKAEMFKEIRTIVPDHFLLVPGVGAQGGDLLTLSKYGLNKEVGLLVNSSRSILYASNDYHFSKSALKASQSIAIEMEKCLEKFM